MKQIQTIGNSLIVVKVPEDAYDFGFMKHNNSLFYWLTSNKTISEGNGDMIRMDLSIENLKILGKLSELSEENCSKFVHKMIGNNPSEQEIKFRGKYYNYLDYTIYCLTAKESLISLLQSNRVDTNKNLLLIEIL